MKWTDKKPDIYAKPITQAFSEVPVLSLLEILSSSIEAPHVFISDTVKKQIIEHITENETESGGLLLGEVLSVDNLESGVIAVHVTKSVPSEDFDATSVSLCMGTAVWDTARRHTTKSNFVVGWYHSHPNLGAFFSGTDRQTQAAFFNKNYHLGLVIDPIRDEECWFVSGESSPVPLTHVWSGYSELLT
ncbi:Mov34/MPN/PAD-1 family protein [Vibrio coralliilyticus]|uniref:MPN domain-containing protein n=1 Tax=Vibrio coralliilyticus TaxID=190893 RepID=A0AAP7DCS8_9VIBR|nr:Mov34/MPN/PAD-1 family protein [Vibrio coralliilyticus]NOJ23228.1 hypothetical protein [Vibrio coralliilyticus]